MPAKQWSKSHFLTYVKSDILLNNLCECFNNVVLDDTKKSIVTILIDMHIGFMKRIQSRMDKMMRSGCNICPKIVKKLLSYIEMAGNNEVEWNGGSQWYVKEKDGEFVIDIHAKTYACGSKIQARKSNKNTTSSSQDQPPPAEFHFMPTPGIGQSNAAGFNNDGPTVDATMRSRHIED
ncbi:DBD Tnp Mut domain-containing protein [Abeliophyllum distichum]|uniref:DBD Tnp Mut domain-containing protein n=1 Tax=Abeliophyllum distichum TaxID=126358 RepID=A0ABD1PDN9_9LAMI